MWNPNSFDDPLMVKHYPNGVPKPGRPVEIEYVNPWEKEYLSRKDDLQPSPSAHDFDTVGGLDFGRAHVIGFGLLRPIIGTLWVSVNLKGEMTLAITAGETDGIRGAETLPTKHQRQSQTSRILPTNERET